MIGVPTSSPLSSVTNINMGSDVDDDNKTEHLQGSVSAVRQADTESLMRGDVLYQLAMLTEQSRGDKGDFYFYPKSNFTKNFCILAGGITIGSIVTGVINHFQPGSQKNSQSAPDTKDNNPLGPYSQFLRDSDGTASIQDLGKSDCPPTYCPPSNCEPLFGEKISFDVNKKVMQTPIRNPGGELKVLDDLSYEISHARKKVNDFLQNTSLIKSDEKVYELTIEQWKGIRNSLEDADGTVHRHRDTIFKRDASIAKDYFNTCNERVGEYVGEGQMDKFLQIPMDLPRIIEMVGDLNKVDLRAYRDKFDLDELKNEVNKITLRMPTSATSKELFVTPHEIEYLSNIFKLIVEHKDTHLSDSSEAFRVSNSYKEYQAQLEALDNLFVAYEPIKNGDSAGLKLDDWRLVVSTLTDVLSGESLTLGAEVNKLTLNLVDRMRRRAELLGKNDTFENFKFKDSKDFITLDKVINDSQLNTLINNIMKRTNDPDFDPPLISGKEANEICERLMELPRYCVTNKYIDTCH